MARSCRACARRRDSSSDAWLEHGLVLGNLAGSVRALRGMRPREAGLARGLIGREVEQARIERAVAAARQGGSAVLVIRGDAGAGKSAVLDEAVARARDLTVLRSRRRSW
jgi:hypothetical protein